jgi:protease PrsW
MSELFSKLPAIFIIMLINAGAAVLWLFWLESKETSFPRFRSPRWFYPFFFFGAMSVIGAWVLEDDRLGEYFVPFQFGSAAIATYNILFIAIIEEGSKFAAYLFLTRRWLSIREPFDAAIGGATIGLGFAIVENIVYGFRLGPAVSLMRSFITIQAHMLYSALPAVFFALVSLDRDLKKAKGRAGMILFGFAFAILLHGIDNTILYFKETAPFSAIADIAMILALGLMMKKAEDASPYRTFPWHQWARALSAIQQGLDADPENPNLLFRRGLYNLSRGRWVDACVAFDGVVETGRRGDLARSFYAVALYASGETEPAEALFGDHWPKLSDRERRLFANSLLRAMPMRPILRAEIGDLTRKCSWTPAYKAKSRR